MTSRRRLGIALVVAMVGAAGVVSRRNPRSPQPGDEPAGVAGAGSSRSSDTGVTPGRAAATPLDPAGRAGVGPRGEGAIDSAPKEPARPPGARRARAPRIDPAFLRRDPARQAEANARSVVEAARTGKNPERLSPLIVPPPFDELAFARDPQAYLDVIEPGRVFQSADEDEGVRSLEPEGLVHLEVEPKGSVRLAVVGEPLSPVTFTSFDRGAFENNLTSITVLADAAGEAHVKFTATVGTIEDVNILSASPLTVGQVAFRVTVTSE